MRAIYFQTYVHGVSGTYAWTWTPGSRHSVNSAILLEAGVCLDVARTALDLRRLTREIVAFHKSPADVALLFSLASMPHVPAKAGQRATHVKQTETAYEGLFFEGSRIGFISERQIERGMLDKYKLLIAPAAARVSDAVVERVRAFADRGGTVLLVGECFSQDRRSSRRADRIQGANVHRIPVLSGPAEARAKLAPWLDKLRLRPGIAIETSGAGPPVVEWRCAKDGAGADLLYLLNMGHKPTKIRIRRAGRAVAGVDLLSRERIGPDHTLASLELRIVRLDK